MKKSLAGAGSVGVASRFQKIGGQVPTKENLALMKLAEKPPVKFTPAMLMQDNSPRFTPQSVLDGLGLDPKTYSDWHRYLRQLAAAPNELVVRRDLMTKMVQDGFSPELRRALFQRTMSFYRGMRKSMVEVMSLEDLKQYREWQRQNYLARTAGGVQLDSEGNVIIESLEKSTIYYGPKGGKWADPQHKIPYVESDIREPDPKWPDIEPVLKKMDAPELYALQLIGKFDEGIMLHGGKGNTHFAATQGTVGVNRKHLDVPATHPMNGVMLEGMRELFKRGWLTVENFGPGVQRITPKPIAKKAADIGVDNIASKLWVYKKKGIRGGKRLFGGVTGAQLSATNVLKKADPKGGKYHRRVPKAGGGFKYYYDPEKYESSKDAHVDGTEAAHKAIKAHVQKCFESAGDKGVPLTAMKSMVKRYGSETCGKALDGMKSEGLTYKGGSLYLKKKTKPTNGPEKTK